MLNVRKAFHGRKVFPNNFQKFLTYFESSLSLHGRKVSPKNFPKSLIFVESPLSWSGSFPKEFVVFRENVSVGPSP